jgi:hypothetical protein
MQDPLACNNREEPHIECVECPKCRRKYEVKKIIHTCNIHAPCDVKKVRHKEQWLEADSLLEPLKSILCGTCVRRQKRADAAKPLVCPGCNYSGYYKSDNTRLCPVCVNDKKSVLAQSTQSDCITIDLTGEDTPTQDNPTPTNTLDVSMLAPTNLYMVVDIISKGLNPYIGILYGITILGYTNESVTTRDWYPLESHYLMEESRPNDHMFGRVTINDINDFWNHVQDQITILKLSHNLNIIWPSGVNMLWIKASYEQSNVQKNITF